MSMDILLEYKEVIRLFTDCLVYNNGKILY